MSLQGGDGLGRPADRRVCVTFREPSKSRPVGTHEVEAFGINLFKRNEATHRSLCERFNLRSAAGAICQLVYALNAGEGAVAVETHGVKSGPL
jgi:hypothetical protein